MTSRLPVLSLWLAATASVTLPVAARASDRPLAWVVADQGLQQQLNALAARGMRLAAVSDGLPQPVIVMQAPGGDAPTVEYRVVTDKDLPTTLQPLVDEGFVPVAAARRTHVRTQVIFERAGATSSRVAWTLIEFADLDALEAALAAAAGDGFRARVLVQSALKSWPGLSHRGMVLASKDGSGAPRDVRVVLHKARTLDEAATRLTTAVGEGFEVDLLFTATRDGAQEGRRDRLVISMSRSRGPASKAPAVRLERTSSFGTFGSGTPLGAAPFWDQDYVYAWSPAERRQTWVSPITLSASEAKGVGLEFKLRVDGDDEETSDVIGLVARPFMADKYYLMVLTDRWLGPKPSR